jgi:hypothetical protein
MATNLACRPSSHASRVGIAHHFKTEAEQGFQFILQSLGFGKCDCYLLTRSTLVRIDRADTRIDLNITIDFSISSIAFYRTTIDQFIFDRLHHGTRSLILTQPIDRLVGLGWRLLSYLLAAIAEIVIVR